MATWPIGESAWPRRVHDWLKANDEFRKYVLAELRARGPLRARNLKDRALLPWRSSGWTHERNVSQMLEFLGARGEVAVTGREGNERIWDLAPRVLPNVKRPFTGAEAREILARRRLRSLGITRTKTVGGIA